MFHINRVAVLLLLVSPSLAYFSFRLKIPNGESVPHPCKANYQWSGVGHQNVEGGGPRNSFGQDFHQAGKQWTEELCRKDSDGDGKTNGEELGDPNCVWKEGEVAERVSDISHPGVCTPYGEGVCQGKDTFVDCSIESFGDSCNLTKDEDITTMDLKFQEISVPSTETNYYCQYYEFSDEGDFHIVANEGLIDNHQVVHHMIIYGCPDNFQLSSSTSYPQHCSMKARSGSCSTPISMWTVGLPGNCFGRDMGFRVGRTGYKKVKLEIHYNNPLLEGGHTDASGFRLYLQRERAGVQDLTTFTVGQKLLAIPPGQERVEFSGSLPSECSKSIIVAPMYVVMTLNHMHYLGRSQKTEVLRGGKVVKVLADDTVYSYDNPKSHRETPVYKVLPGDEIRTTCAFSSMTRKEYVYYGDGTNDEMCYAFLTVYPKQALPRTQWCPMTGPLSICDVFFETSKDGCDWKAFTDLSNPELQAVYRQAEEHCSLDGTCLPDCLSLVKEIEAHPCLSEEMKPLVEDLLRKSSNGQRLVTRINSCWGYDDNGDDGDDDNEVTSPPNEEDPDGDGQGPMDTASLPVPKMAVVLTFSVLALVLSLATRLT